MLWFILIRLVVTVELAVLIYIMVWIIKKHRYVPLILYFLSLILMLLAVFVDMLGYFGVSIEVSMVGRSLELVDFLFTEFVVSAIVMWALSLHFTDHDRFTWVALLLIMIASAATIGELLEVSLFAEIVNLTLEMLGLGVFAYIVVSHYVKSRWGLRISSMRKLLALYIAGFLLLIVTGAVSLGAVVLDPKTEATLGHLWVLGLGTSLFLSGFLLVKYPTILFVNISRPKKYILATKDGTPILSFSFISSDSDDLDPEIVGSALSGISSLLKTIAGTEVPLKSISFGDYHIMVFVGKILVGYLFVEKPSRIIRESMAKITDELEELLSGIVEEGFVVLAPKIIAKAKKKVADIIPYIE